MEFSNSGTIVGETGAAGGAKRRFYATVVKRVLDIFFVLLALPFFGPLILMLAVLVARDGGRPFYYQNRVGKHGQVFRLIKLRTMIGNADVALERHLAENPEARREWDVHQKLSYDPRVTPIGRILRQTSLDELPQLWNILRGDMSLVGPRPIMCNQRDLYLGNAYFELSPGITGPWQVSERSTSEFTARARYDDDYFANLSLLSDMLILMRTVGAVFRRTGV